MLEGYIFFTSKINYAVGIVKLAIDILLSSNNSLFSSVPTIRELLSIAVIHLTTPFKGINLSTSNN